MNATKKAEAALERVRAEKVRAERELGEQRAALAALESAAGAKILAARVDADQVAEERVGNELAAARARVDLTERAVAASVGVVRAAQLAVGLARAGDLRAEAARLMEEARPRLTESTAMLDALAEREGCKWLPWPAVHSSGAVLEGSWSQTKTGEMLAAIVALELEASHLEAIGGETPKPSLLCDVPDVRIHLGSAGIFRAAPSQPVTVAKTVTGADIAKAYRDSQPLRS
jgi:hypothetical protein